MSVPVLSWLLRRGGVRGAAPAGSPLAAGAAPEGSARSTQAPAGAGTARANSAQPLEPILFPRLRIQLADFPYLHYSTRLEAAHLGDLMRLSVRPGVESAAPPDFHGPSQAHRTRSRRARSAGSAALSPGNPIPGPPRRQQEKTTLPGASAGVSGLARVATACHIHIPVRES